MVAAKNRLLISKGIVHQKGKTFYTRSQLSSCNSIIEIFEKKIEKCIKGDAKKHYVQNRKIKTVIYEE